MSQSTDTWLQELMQKDPLIHWGIANPKGEPDSKSTTYFQEGQLQELQKHVVGLPVHIDHVTENNGTPIEPCGRVVMGAVHPATGKLYVGIVFSDTKNGRIAKVLRGETPGFPEDQRFGEMSLGYDVIMDQSTGKVVGNKATEISICPKGARDGTKFTSTSRLSDLLDRVTGNKFSGGGISSHPSTQDKNIVSLGPHEAAPVSSHFISSTPPLPPTMNKIIYTDAPNPPEVPGSQAVPPHAIRPQILSSHDKRPTPSHIHNAFNSNASSQYVSVSATASASSAAAAPPVAAALAPTPVIPKGMPQEASQTAAVDALSVLMRAAYPDGLPDPKARKISAESTPHSFAAPPAPIQLDPLDNSSSDEFMTQELTPEIKIDENTPVEQRAIIAEQNARIRRGNEKIIELLHFRKQAEAREREQINERLKNMLLPALNNMLADIEPSTADKTRASVKDVANAIRSGPNASLNESIFNTIAAAASAYTKAAEGRKVNAAQLEAKHQREEQLNALVAAANEKIAALEAEMARLRGAQSRPLYSTETDRFAATASQRPAMPAPVSIPATASFSTVDDPVMKTKAYKASFDAYMSMGFPASEASARARNDPMVLSGLFKN